MASPLQYGDPPRLGPYVVQARLHMAPAGFVYLGQAPDGRAAVSYTDLKKKRKEDFQQEDCGEAMGDIL
ncbi:hypothetical protein ETD85_51870, partial [Nonomuraea zeae]